MFSRTQLVEKYLSHFEGRGHQRIPSVSLVPENDPTVLFTTAGMHPLVPYFLGEKHPGGKRVANVQKCLRTDDIEEVGDAVHHTFFEMLGNWSFGDYFKKEAIEWSFEFLTSAKYLNIPKEKIAISIFSGDEDAPADEESFEIWRKIGIPEARVKRLDKKENWWGPAGQTGPCGPDTEMFVWVGGSRAPEKFDSADGRWVEVWNDVFMEYERYLKIQSSNLKMAEGKQFGFRALKQKNVDTGMGLERMISVLNGIDDDYKTELFWPMIEKLQELSGKKYEENKPEFRIIADHLKAAVFLVGAGVQPTNKDRGYVCRRLIRRAVVKANQIGIIANFTAETSEIVARIYGEAYPEVLGKEVGRVLEEEEIKFRKNLKRALLKLEKVISGTKIGERGEDGLIRWSDCKMVASELFDLFQQEGMPIEVSLEEARRLKIPIVEQAYEQADLMRKIQEEYQNRYRCHQEQSRTASAGMFKGGLADAGEKTTRLHTAAHLMLAALRKVLGEHVVQKGSNITPERLRLDFSHKEKVTPEQLKGVEDLVNEQIKKNLPVECEEMSVEQAKKSGAMGVFDKRYGNNVKVYSIAPFSREICGGPHVKTTGELGRFKIVKEESSSGGVRRIKAVLK